MATRGTTSRSKTELSEEIENLGARYTGHSDREFTSYGLQCFGNDANRAVSILGDMITNNAFNTSEFELLKDEVTAEHE
jgi:predicted Zn-dependent peptidase